jgi:integrase
MHSESQISDLANRTNYLSYGELVDMLRCSRRTFTRDWAILAVGYWHGLRNQEIAKLRLNDIDWSSQTITVSPEVFSADYSAARQSEGQA